MLCALQVLTTKHGGKKTSEKLQILSLASIGLTCNRARTLFDYVSESVLLNLRISLYNESVINSWRCCCGQWDARGSYRFLRLVCFA